MQLTGITCQSIDLVYPFHVLLFQLAQFDRDVSSGHFKTYVIHCLAKLAEYRQFERTWDIDVSVEREQIPEGAVEEEDSDEEDEDAISGLMQRDTAAHGQLVTDSAVGSHGSQHSEQSDSTGEPVSIELGESDQIRLVDEYLFLHIIHTVAPAIS